MNIVYCILTGIVLALIIILIVDRQAYKLGNICLFSFIWKFFNIEKIQVKK